MICSVISINLIKQTKLWEILTQTWDFSWMEMVMLKSIIQKNTWWKTIHAKAVIRKPQGTFHVELYKGKVD